MKRVFDAEVVACEGLAFASRLRRGKKKSIFGTARGSWDSHNTLCYSEFWYITKFNTFKFNRFHVKSTTSSALYLLYIVD